MAYKQTYIPNINIGAVRGWCLGYVDDTLSAPQIDRSYSAQIAYNRAVARGWLHGDYNFPTNVWVILFWSIDNGAQAGLGHVANAFIGDNGAMQIHDSEVHAGARSPYGSIQELLNWFASGSVRLTFLGWALGCDGVKILKSPQENVQEEAARKQAEAEAQQKAEEAEAQRQADEIEKKSIPMAECIVRVKDDFEQPFIKDSVFYWSPQTGFINIPDPAGYNYLDKINQQINGKILPRLYSTKGEPVHARLAQINGAVNVKTAKAIK